MQTKTAKQLAEFTAEMLTLHYGPGPHPDGSPQSVHGGDTGSAGTPTRPSTGAPNKSSLEDAWRGDAQMPGTWRGTKLGGKVMPGHYEFNQGDTRHQLIVKYQRRLTDKSNISHHVSAVIESAPRDNPRRAASFALYSRSVVAAPGERQAEVDELKREMMSVLKRRFGRDFSIAEPR